MTKTLRVNQEIKITVDESKFTPEFNKSFSEVFHLKENTDDHIKYIAELYGRGVITSDREFVEGYGILRDFGIFIKREDIWVEDY